MSALAVTDAEVEVARAARMQALHELGPAVGVTMTENQRNHEAMRKALEAAAELRRGEVVGVFGECVECGTDPETGTVRIIVVTTMEALRDGPPLVYRNVTVAAAPAAAGGEGEN